MNVVSPSLSSQALVIIPSRLNATRLPQKPLADIGGKPMVLRVWEQACQANVGPVVVAAGDPQIQEVIQGAGGTCVLTDPALTSGSDRVAQAADLVDPEKHFGVVVNVQGDLPGLDPQMVRDVLKPVGDGEKNYHIATIASPLGKGEKDRSSVVKIALAHPHGPGTWAQALYFSRAPIPFGSPEEGWHHIGLYAYRRQALERMVALAPSLLEKSENLEQLRAMEAGMTLGVYLTATLPPLGVDTPEDLERVRALIAPC